MRVDDLPEVLYEDGLTLRRYQSDDAAAVRDAVVESGTDLSLYETWAVAGFTSKDAADYVGWWVSGWDEGSDYYFGIWQRDHFVGSCGLAGVDRFHGRASLGFWVRSAEIGHGVATSAARAVVGFAFEHLGLHRVEVIAALDNTASRRVAEKAGAREEGILRRRLVLDGVPHDAVMMAAILER